MKHMQLRKAVAMIEFMSHKIGLFSMPTMAQYANRIARMANSRAHAPCSRKALAQLHAHFCANVAAYGDALHESIVPLIDVNPIE